MSLPQQMRQALTRSVSLRWGPELLLLLVGLAIVYPLWVVARPPIQDLPQHVAAVRVLASYTDPSYRFQEYFELTLGKTQYLTVYLLAVPLAKLVGPTLAIQAVLSLVLILTPLAILRLMRALAFDESLAFLSLPFLFNVHVAYGFLNFVAAIPLLFLGLALAVEQRCHPSRAGRIGLGAVLFVCFYTHVVPFGILALATVLLVRWNRQALMTQAIVVLPSATALVFWLSSSPAGKVVSSLGRGEGDGSLLAAHLPFGLALRILPEWITHVTTAESEYLRLIVWFIAALVLLVLSVSFSRRSTRSNGAAALEASLTQTASDTATSARGQPAFDHAALGPRQAVSHDVQTKLQQAKGADTALDRGQRANHATSTNRRRPVADESELVMERVVVLLLVPLSMVAYFALPNGYGFIWPICQRFPVLAILLGLPLVGRAPPWALRMAAALSAALAIAAAAEQSDIFRVAGEQGYRGFDEVVNRIPKGSRVATLVFERQVEGLQLSPLMHAAGWVQAQRGGVVMFSFAEFPSSPFRYRANRRPPPVAPRWEWGPERVVPDRDLGWYDYCLVQGWSGSLETSRRFNEVWRRGRWSLWRRMGPADANTSDQ